MRGILKKTCVIFARRFSADCRGKRGWRIKQEEIGHEKYFAIYSKRQDGMKRLTPLLFLPEVGRPRFAFLRPRQRQTDG